MLGPSPAEKARESHYAVTKKGPVHIGTGHSLFPRYHPICPIARTSLAGHQHVPSLLTVDDTDPVYSPFFWFSTGGSRGILGKVSAPALTNSGSLSASAYLLVSIIAFAAEPYHRLYLLSTWAVGGFRKNNNILPQDLLYLEG